MDAIERIEVALRVDIALLLGARSSLAHREPAHLHGNFAVRTVGRTGRTRHQDWLGRLDQNAKRSNEEFVRRFQSKYNSELPIWIAVELWDFGLLSHFVSGMRVADIQTLAAKYQLPDWQLLPSWVRSLNDVRNVCAHHGRLWNRSLPYAPRLPRPGMIPELDHLVAHRLAHHRLYTPAAITRHFLSVLNPTTTWPQRLQDQFDTFPSAPGVDVAHSGFPPNWQTEAFWLP